MSSADDLVRVAPLAPGWRATVRVPGSKSITNRALLLAGLADGVSTIDGILVADDSEAMLGSLRSLGVEIDIEGDVATVRGHGVPFAVGAATLDCRSSGTTARFLLPVLAAAGGPYSLIGDEQLQRRPMSGLVASVRALGAEVSSDSLPLTVGAAAKATGRRLRVQGNVTSQFVSAMLIGAPLLGGLLIDLTTELVAAPFVSMTASVMEAFGAGPVRTLLSTLMVEAGSYRPVEHFVVEPDASAAAYFFAAAALTGGEVEVEGFRRDGLQGDAAFVDLLERVWDGGTFDLSDMPDQALTLAAVAPFARAPVRIEGIGFIRGHESDRIAVAVGELRKLGVDARDEGDAIIVQPGEPAGGRVDSHGDHRVAMSFALIGLRVDGIEIAGASCVDKTFPGYWDALGSLRLPSP